MEQQAYTASDKPAVSKWTIAGILCLCFALYASWACVIPVEITPDEFNRFILIRYIFETGQLPFGNEEAVRIPYYGTSYAYSVYGSTLLAELLLFPFKVLSIDLDGVSMLLISRFVDVILATATTALCFPIGSRLFKRPASILLFALLVGVLPQFVFLASYFNCDVLGVFSTALVMLFLLRGHEGEWRIRDCILLGVSLGVCSLSYYFAYGAIVVSVFAYYASAIQICRKKKGLRASLLVGRPLIILASALLVAGWFFIRFFILYDGDMFGRRMAAEASEQYAADSLKPSAHLTPQMAGMSPWDMLFGSEPFNQNPWIPATVKSFIGVFGGLVFELSPNEYLIYQSIIGIGLVVGAIACFRDRAQRLWSLWMVMLMVIPLILNIYYSWSSDYQPQGRYLMASLPAIMFFVARGWETIASGVGKALAPILQKSPRLAKVDANAISTGLTILVAIIWLAAFAHVVYNAILPHCVGPLFDIDATTNWL